MITPEQLEQLWVEVKRRVKAIEINRPLWRALDAARPILLDRSERRLVVGLEGEQFHEASAFDVAENRAAIQKVLAAVTNQPLDLLAIEGATEADYRAWGERQAVLAQMGEQTVAKLEQDEEGGGSIHRLLMGVTRELHVLYRDLPQRSQSLHRGRFVFTCFDKLIDAEQQMAKMDGTPDQKERQLSRAIDRLADIVDVGAVVLAMEYERYKRDKGLG